MNALKMTVLDNFHNEFLTVPLPFHFNNIMITVLLGIAILTILRHLQETILATLLPVVAGMSPTENLQAQEQLQAHLSSLCCQCEGLSGQGGRKGE